MIELAGQTVRAVSVGGLETCIELPNYKLCFDIGRCPPTAVRYRNVLFTHAHTDHMGGVVHHCATRDMQSMPPPTYAVPAEIAEPFSDMMAAWRRLNHTALPHELLPVRPGDVLPLGKGRRAHVFRAIHRVPSVGYAICSERRSLRPDLVGLPGREIQARRQAGEEITVSNDVVEVAFCGDTVIDVVDREPLVRQARLLILEVTFLDDRVSVERARSQGHIHLDEVAARADLFENEALLFTHRSVRYGDAEARRLVAERLPAHLAERVTLLSTLGDWQT